MSSIFTDLLAVPQTGKRLSLLLNLKIFYFVIKILLIDDVITTWWINPTTDGDEGGSPFGIPLFVTNKFPRNNSFFEIKTPQLLDGIQLVNPSIIPPEKKGVNQTRALHSFSSSVNIFPFVFLYSNKYQIPKGLISRWDDGPPPGASSHK
jgi:hypothetical protein